MNSFERLVRVSVVQTLRDFSRAPSPAEIASGLGIAESAVRSALHALAGEHRLALVPATDSVWMAHPFSAVASDFVVGIGDRRWYANCAWDGLSILALLGDGTLDTHSPETQEPIRFDAAGGQVIGKGLVHFLVPARSFWDDIGFT
jgi:hypothetical protein